MAASRLCLEPEKICRIGCTHFIQAIASVRGKWYDDEMLKHSMATLEAHSGTNAAGEDPWMERIWGKTVRAVQGLNDRHPDRFVPPDEHAPNGSYQDPSRPGEFFPIIGRDNDVNGGVYIGENAREIILVEAKKKKEEKGSLEGLYEWVTVSLSALKKLKPKWGEQEIIEAVYKMICERVEYDSRGVDRLTVGKNDQIVPLEAFLENGVGVCRHQSLTGSYLLQRLKKDGALPEAVQISNDRNRMFGGGHAWVRITLSNGEVMIMDAAQGYCGLLKNAGEKARGWAYERPEDVDGEVDEVNDQVASILELTGYKKINDLKTPQQEVISSKHTPVIIGFLKSLFRIEKIAGEWTITNLSPGYRGFSKSLVPREYGNIMTFGRNVDATSGPAFRSADSQFSGKHFTIVFQKDTVTVTSKSDLLETEIWKIESRKEDATPLPIESEEEIRARVAEEMAIAEYELSVHLPPRIKGKEPGKEILQYANHLRIGYSNIFFEIRPSTDDGWIIRNVATGLEKTVNHGEFGKPYVFGREAEDPALRANGPYFSRQHFSVIFRDHDFAVSALSTKKPTEIWVRRKRAFSARIFVDQTSLDSFAEEFGKELKKEMQMKREIGFNFSGFAGQLEFVRAYARQFLEKYYKGTQIMLDTNAKELIYKALPSLKNTDDDTSLLVEFFVAQYVGEKFGFV